MNQIIRELSIKKENAVINDLYEDAKYFSYQLYNLYVEKAKHDFNSYFENTRQQFLEFLELCSISLHLTASKASYSTQEIISDLNNILYKINNYHIDLTINSNIYSVLEDYYNEWSNEGFIPFSGQVETIISNFKKLSSTISKISHLDTNYCMYYLFQLSMLEYLKSCVYFINLSLGIIVDKEIIEESITKGIIYYPGNYLLYSLGELNFGNKATLKYNWLQSDLRTYYNFSYINGGSNHNSKKEFKQAETVYNWGLQYSIFGTTHTLLYKLALNYQDFVYENNIFNSTELDLSIDCAKEALYQYKISIDNNLIYRSINQQYKLEESYDFILKIYNLISVSYMRKKDNDNAGRYLDEGVKYFITKVKTKSPDILSLYGDLLSNRGLLRIRNEKYLEALEDLFTSLNFRTKNPDSVKLNISTCYYHIKNYHAMDKISSSLVNSASNPDIKASAIYNNILANSKLNNLTKIQNSLKKYLLLTPSDNEIFNLIGTIYQNQKEDKKSEDFYLQGFKKGNINSCYHLALLYKNRSKDNFKKYFKEYIKKSIKQMDHNCSNYNSNSIKKITLYKYKTINKNTIQSLLDNYIYFSSIFKLNDPFDCMLIQEYSNDIDFRKVFDEIGNPLIFSLSKNKSNDLMWSHYADEHRGICIGYNFDNDKLIKNQIFLYKVKYIRDQIYSKNIALNDLKTSNTDDYIKQSINDSLLLNDIIAKDILWEYENEIRLFNFKKNKHFNDDFYTINSITFGCLCSTEDIKTIVNIFSYKYKDFNIEENTIINEKGSVSFSKLKKSANYVRKLEEDIDFNISNYINH